MEVIPDEFKTPDFYAEIIKHGEFYPKDIPNEYLTEEALIQYVSSKKCYGLDDIPNPWKTTPAVMKAFSDYHIDRYIYPDEEHCERACERAEKNSKNAHWNIFFPNVKSNHPNMSGMSFVIHEPEFMQLKIQQEKCGEHPSRNFRKIYWKHQNGSCKLIL